MGTTRSVKNQQGLVLWRTKFTTAEVILTANAIFILRTKLFWKKLRFSRVKKKFEWIR